MDLILSLIKLPDILTKLILSGDGYHLLNLSSITKFINLQELRFSFYFDYALEDFKSLQYATFSQLRILELQYSTPKYELLIKFLENNGKSLKEFYLGDQLDFSDNSLNLAIAKFCPNLRKISIGFNNNEFETLKIVFNSCQYLESIKIWCGGKLLSEKEALEMVVKYSPKNTNELALFHIYREWPKLLPKDLESFFVSWTNRIPQKLLSLVIINNGHYSIVTANSENMKIIEKYIKLGIIKFKAINER